MVSEVEKTLEKIGNVPFMTRDEALFMDNLIKTHDLKDILELGFMYGASSSYMASTLKELGRGHLTTIDLVEAKTRHPNIELLLNQLGLRDYVTIYYEETSYTWRLMKFLEEHTEPIFDLCYIDGAHDWFTDGFAFLLVDKLLKPGGWVIFDDMYWTHCTSPFWKDQPEVQEMPYEEKTTPQVSKIYELLVKRHPDYCNFEIYNNVWGIAQKKFE